jgi:hypothetical protein
MVRHDAYDVADFGPIVSGGKVEETVLLGEANELRLRMLKNKAMALEATGVAGQGLRSGIQNPATRLRPTDHRSVDRQGTIGQAGAIIMRSLNA